ncbi:MAG: MFS transporter [Schleiferiaceae bacterium]|jgi:glycoside/pentoside/hexuronide:cation symporter, GPH family
MSSATNKVPMGQKIAFGVGMLANQMFPAAMGIFMVVLVQDLGFPGWMWGVIFFAPRAFDAILDPIMGYISDNTRSRWGRRRQYVFIGALIMGVSFACLWQLYRENSVAYNFTYVMLWSFVFYLGLTIFGVPYVSMGYEMSDDYHERTNVMAISQWIGQWAWVIAPWFWVIMYDPDWFPTADEATRTLAVWVAVVFTLCAMAPAFFIKSESTKDRVDYEPLNLSGIFGSLKNIALGFKEAFSSVPFRRLCIATFLIFNGFNTIASFTFFVIKSHLFNDDASAVGVWPTLFGSVGALITTFLVIPIVAWMSKALGKKRAFILSQGISIIGYVLLWFLMIPGKPYMFLFALPFHSFGIGGLFTIMMSMTSDVLDIDELNTGKRREGVFGAIYWWMVKLGFAFAGALSGLILTAVNYQSGGGAQPEGAVDGLRMFFSGLPILCTLIAIAVMWNYKVDENYAKEVRAKLDQRKSQQ